VISVVVSLFTIASLPVARCSETNSTIPSEPGMYVQAGEGFTKIIGQIAQFTRTGSRFVSGITVGIKAAKANIQLQGAHAQTVVSPQPVFYLVPPKQAMEAGVNAGDLILIRLEEKAQRRQFEIAAEGLFRSSAGISLTHQIQLFRSEPKPGVYRITPATELKAGEYALYLARGEGMAAYVYDFGVQGGHFASGSQSQHVASALSQRPVDSTQPAPEIQNSSPTPVDAPSTKSQGAVLGINGADWDENGATGVEILQIVENSSAQLAGLRKGNVITNVNGVHVRSNQELTNLLGQLEPGTKVTITYLYRSNLGWMPQETVAILSHE
jgi:membrane-associated protease RseP (regulator of RpoE activity)